MDTRLLAVLTDLDLAEHHRARQNYAHALNLASVALINALEGHKEHPASDDWENAVHRAFAVKRAVLDNFTN